MAERETKTCYHYHADTGELIGPGEADPDPKVKDNWLVPRFATLKAPPEAPKGKAAVFKDGDWELVTDQRGRYYLPDGTPGVLNELGKERPKGATTEKPEPTLEQRTEEVARQRTRLYRERVDPLTLEAMLKRQAGDEQQAQELTDQAMKERARIQGDNPWPKK